ncbi:MAG: TetR family transcriptional regulator, partial [Planctomycetota bacterium]
MTWQRARKPDQKAERADAILDAAAALFDEKELSDISMRDVAERAGLGKASLYHYFKTKEEVFISLYRSELDEWLPDVQRRMNRLRAPNPSRVAKVLTDVLRERTRLCRLTVVFSFVLEHNLSPEFIRRFKTSLLDPLGQFSGSMKEVLDLSDESIHCFLFQHHATIAGLWPLAHPSPAVAQVLEDDQFAVFRIDFYHLFEQTIRQLL